MFNRKMISSIVLALSLVLTTPSVSFADASGNSNRGKRVVTLGADLTPAEQKKMIKYFKADPSKCKVIYVTNAEERVYMSAEAAPYIGDRTWSSSYIQPTQKGGIRVHTANLTWVTGSMIANTLTTCGITNCDVIAASPIQCSGTGALTGIMKAYETTTGRQLQPRRKKLACREMDVTARVGNRVGRRQAQRMVTRTKLLCMQKKVRKTQDISVIVGKTEKTLNVSLSKSEKKELINLMAAIMQEEYENSDELIEILEKQDEVLNMEKSTSANRKQESPKEDTSSKDNASNSENASDSTTVSDQEDTSNSENPFNNDNGSGDEDSMESDFFEVDEIELLSDGQTDVISNDSEDPEEDPVDEEGNIIPPGEELVEEDGVIISREDEQFNPEDETVFPSYEDETGEEDSFEENDRIEEDEFEETDEFEVENDTLLSQPQEEVSEDESERPWEETDGSDESSVLEEENSQFIIEDDMIDHETVSPEKNPGENPEEADLDEENDNEWLEVEQDWSNEEVLNETPSENESHSEDGFVYDNPEENHFVMPEENYPEENRFVIPENNGPETPEEFYPQENSFENSADPYLENNFENPADPYLENNFENPADPYRENNFENPADPYRENNFENPSDPYPENNFENPADPYLEDNFEDPMGEYPGEEGFEEPMAQNGMQLNSDADFAGAFVRASFGRDGSYEDALRQNGYNADHSVPSLSPDQADALAREVESAVSSGGSNFSQIQSQMERIFGMTGSPSGAIDRANLSPQQRDDSFYAMMYFLEDLFGQSGNYDHLHGNDGMDPAGQEEDAYANEYDRMENDYDMSYDNAYAGGYDTGYDYI